MKITEILKSNKALLSLSQIDPVKIINDGKTVIDGLELMIKNQSPQRNRNLLPIIENIEQQLYRF
jgi:hypothetical protein